MAATVSGSKTVTTDVSPQLTASSLTTLLATAPENFTVKQWKQVQDAINRVSGGGAENTTIGTLLP